MEELNPTKLKEELTEQLVKSGIPEQEARQMAAKDVDSMGIVKIASGTCPLGGLSPLACQFCSYGHMTECHYPLTCEEAECKHYQEELAAEGYGDI